jgi:hypothetical protein
MNFTNKVFQEFGNILTPDEHKTCVSFLQQRRWSFDNWAVHEEDKGILCWSMWGLEDEEFFNTTFMHRIREITNTNYQYSRIYANGQSFGQDGVFHVDSDNPNAHTFLYYPTELDPLEVYEFGGETQFIQDTGEMYHVYPFLNTGVLFDGRIWHRGMGPNKWAKQLRISVAFKLLYPNN